MSLVNADNVTKVYTTGEIEVEALKSVSFEIEHSAFISFIGPSGSGKTTLLNCRIISILGLARKSHGIYYILLLLSLAFIT